MSHVQHIDELVREYFVYRGLCCSLRSFDADLKADKDKGFRVDKIVDQIVLFTSTHDLASLLELWCHLEQRIFSRLDNNYLQVVRKLEISILKLYLVNAAIDNKPEKVNEFFTKMATELNGQLEWKEWFALPFIKVPEEHPVYSMYFSRQWQDTLLATLHNFLAIIFQSMQMPTLSSFEEQVPRSKQRATEEVDSTCLRLSTLCSLDSDCKSSESLALASDLMDDFYIIAQKLKTEDHGIESHHCSKKS